ncbi:uridine monophosphate synthetase [Sporothrix brasiliensis 5110]|uniref:Orotidine 5'-phosphate decarboxylase n=1 Tax=Sporothrix brasiliensis 5110 TaxID=1398154 RepID=A0A0C2IXB9_9PEZI|nr:uridine monophosphate synthetase [Sporothrix brasiliensis 5110]KIH91410.1 uridine monophosphate synthetase [Sporothrix brasiliensis 5110]
MGATQHHPSFVTPFAERAETAAHPLTAYLYRLMVAKSSNLCLSADVSTARELLLLADRVGPSIVVLKTHYDLVTGWDYNPQTGTGAQLAALARKHGFLLFEDRKFADIGKTVQQQYTAGTARIIEWAHLVTVNMDAGLPAVTALADAAAHWRERVHYEVKTSVTVGTPVLDSFDDSGSGTASGVATPNTQHVSEFPSQSGAAPTSSLTTSIPSNLFSSAPRANADSGGLPTPSRDTDGRKGSIVSVTTVTQSFEPVDSPRLPRDGTDGRVHSASGGTYHQDGTNMADSTSGSGRSGAAAGSSYIQDGAGAVYPGIEEAPLDRGILLLAQMSTKGNLMTPAYTQACVDAARAHKTFVAGFIAQETLNTAPDDTFVHLTPGCKLPPPGEEFEEKTDANGRVLPGDGMGQQYNTPARLIGVCGADIVIVGRGIITAVDPPSEAERYRRKAWKAYLARVQQ